MSAYTLFKEAGVTSRLYKSFLEPMLLVTLFAPPTELSAAAALGGRRALRAPHARAARFGGRGARAFQLASSPH